MISIRVFSGRSGDKVAEAYLDRDASDKLSARLVCANGCDATTSFELRKGRLRCYGCETVYSGSQYSPGPIA